MHWTCYTRYTYMFQTPIACFLAQFGIFSFLPRPVSANTGKMYLTSWYIVKLLHHAFHCSYVLMLINCLSRDLGLLSFSPCSTRSKLLSREDKHPAECHTALDEDPSSLVSLRFSVHSFSALILRNLWAAAHWTCPLHLLAAFTLSFSEVSPFLSLFEL